MTENPPIRDVDVLILGGSLAGTSMGLLLKRSLPEATITIIEKSEAFTRRVGESTSEVGGCFLTRVLRLSQYLSQHQVVKHGLRLWFQKDGNNCPFACGEIGPFFQARLPTYQLDRSTLDQHLLDLAQTEGCTVQRPARAVQLELEGEGKNRVTVKDPEGNLISYRAKWIVDATGKAALIGRQRGTVQALASHETKSVWARFQKVRDLDGIELAQENPDFAQSCYVSRGSATNHLTGRGWWCWLIPLQNGDLSAGLTYDPRYFEPEKGKNLTDTLLRHLRTHPMGRWMFEEACVVEKDTLAYSQLAYENTQVAGPGWVCVGDAAGFMDPLYSHGIDFIAHTVMSARSMLESALKGDTMESERQRTAYQNEYPACYKRWFEALYEKKYAYIGDADLMKAAFLLDIGAYFIGPVHFVYRDTANEFSKMPYHGPIGNVIAKFMRFYNRRLVSLSEQREARGLYGTHNLHRRILIKPGFAPGLAAVRPFMKGIVAWAKCEYQGLRFRLRPPENRMPTDTSTTTTSETEFPEEAPTIDKAGTNSRATP